MAWVTGADWGGGPFDNDAPVDWLADLQQTDELLGGSSVPEASCQFLPFDGVGTQQTSSWGQANETLGVQKPETTRAERAGPLPLAPSDTGLQATPQSPWPPQRSQHSPVASPRRLQLRSAFQPGQRVFWIALQSPAQQVLDEPAWPPGREDEGSAELDRGLAIGDAADAHVLVIADPQRRRNVQVQAVALRGDPATAVRTGPRLPNAAAEKCQCCPTRTGPSGSAASKRAPDDPGGQ